MRNSQGSEPLELAVESTLVVVEPLEVLQLVEQQHNQPGLQMLQSRQVYLAAGVDAGLAV
jgi:hypothetical protein